MKKTVALAILGVGVAGVNTVMAQGHVGLNNYNVAPYNQIVWDAGVPTVGGTAVLDTQVIMTLWIAPGAGQSAGDLVAAASPSFSVNPGILYDPGAGFGGGGYYDTQVLLTPGEGVYTAQVRFSGVTAYGEVTGASDLFEVTAVSRTLPVPSSGLSIGGTVALVPEPTTFALAGLGAAALLIFRRRD